MPTVLLLMLIIFSNQTFGQNPIGKSLQPIVGDLYHTGGNIGIGTDTPYKLLHLYSDTVTTLRLSSMCDKCDTTSWDFNVFQGNLDFIYKEPNKYFPVLKITEYGQLYLGTDNPDNSAIMQIDNTNKGLLIPRMVTNNKNSISSPVNGLLVYDTDLQEFSYYNSDIAGWVNIAKTSDLSDYLLITDFNNTVAGGITQEDTAHWNTAYNNTLTFTESDPIFTAHPSSDITNTDITNWNTAFAWGNHADAGYLTGYTETDPIFSAWDKDYQDLTNKPDLFDGQWTSLSGSPPNISIFSNDAGYLTNANVSYLWQENGSGNIYRNIGNVGIGTDSPSKSLELFTVYNLNGGDLIKKSTVRLTNKTDFYDEPKQINPPGPTIPDKIYQWDIENANANLNLNFTGYTLPPPVGTNTNPETKFTFASDGTFTATKFVGDGSELTNIAFNGPLILDNPMDAWTNSGWSPRIQSSLGTVWASTNKSNLGDYYLGLGMTNSGWYFMTRKDDNTKRYVCIITQDGLIRATKIIVQQRNWSDFVFNDAYKPVSLDKLETYINQYKHLPDIPTEKEIKKEGLDLGEMQKLQMQKIEELTLYILQLKKENDVLKERILKLEN